jgi:hypothetical protein
MVEVACINTYTHPYQRCQSDDQAREPREFQRENYFSFFFLRDIDFIVSTYRAITSSTLKI